MNLCVYIVFVISSVIANWSESRLQHPKLSSLKRVRRQQNDYLSEDISCTHDGHSGTCKNPGDSFTSTWNVNQNKPGPMAASASSKKRALVTSLSTFQQSFEGNLCVLPPRINHGAYAVSNEPNASPGDALESFELKVSCRRGYGFMELDGGRNSSGLLKIYCVRGLWSQAMPKCVRFCKLNPDPSVRYMCNTPGGGYKICDLYVSPGTTVSPVCNSPVYYSAESLTYMKCIGGFWDYIAKCKAECGRVTPIGEQLLIGGERAKRGELPWHAGIFTKSSVPYMQICGGSLVANNVVISAAHCFWNDVQNQLPAARFAVAVGKLYRPWNSERDIDAQKSDVNQIKLPPLFSGASTNFQEDLAVLIMATPFVYKTFVRPVCLNFDTNFNRRQLQQGKLGKVAGWGLEAANGKPSQVLQVLEIPYISLKTCLEAVPPSFREYITGDKFCAGYTNGTALCKGDSGGGLSFSAHTELDIERYYLRGIVSAAPDSEDLCNTMTYATFTKITKHEDFIKDVVASADKSCSPYLFQCDDGACLHQGADCDGKQDCEDGSDEAKELCTADLAVETEAPDTPTSNSQCVYPTLIENGDYHIINPKESAGQIPRVQQISVSCNKGYNHLSSESEVIKSNSIVMTCINGRWDKSVPKCVSTVSLECGKVYPESVPLALGDRVVKGGELPWHASIFSKKKTPHDHICGGNIISQDLILTAAHCFKMGDDPKSYVIATGKIYASWDNNMDIGIQKSDVLTINISSSYKGDKNPDFKADLAVVGLATSIHFTDYVKPICLNNKNDLEPGKLMRVAAWSLSNFGPKHSRLHRLEAVDMTYIDLRTCNATIADTFRKHTSEDQVCAGYTKDRTRFRSLAGSGVVIPQTLAGVERYYLQGLTAYVVPCRDCRNSTDAYYMFTSVVYNEDFIKQFI